MKKILGFSLFFVLLSTGMSYADSLYLGGTYTNIASIVNNKATTEGGGSISGSYLDGRQLDYIYCVDLFTDVYPNATYDTTTVNSDGLIHGNTIKNVGEVAWLLETYGTGGQGDQAMALQAAIWTLVNPDGVYSLDSNHYGLDSTIVKDYNVMLARGAGKTGDISDFLWINPGKDETGTQTYQGLVTSAPTPEPATMLLFGTGLAGLAALRLRKK